MVLKSRDYVFKSLYLRDCLLYCTVYTGTCTFILKVFSLRVPVGGDNKALKNNNKLDMLRLTT